MSALDRLEQLIRDAIALRFDCAGDEPVAGPLLRAEDALEEAWVELQERAS